MLHTPGHLCVPGSASAAKPRAGPRPAGQGALPHSALASRWLWAESLGQADLTQFKGLWDKAVPRPPPPAPGTESGGGAAGERGRCAFKGTPSVHKRRPLPAPRSRASLSLLHGRSQDTFCFWKSRQRLVLEKKRSFCSGIS